MADDLARKEYLRQYHAKRYAEDAAYRERRRERLQAWQQENRDHVNAGAKAWYDDNKEAVNARRKDPVRRKAEQERANARYENDETVRERKRRSDREWRANNPGASFKRKYGLQWETYQQMLRDQESKCAICRAEPQRNRPLCVDHCHTTDRVRELLCRPCNAMLGFVKDRPDVLRAAAAYLERHQSRRKVA